MEVILQQDFPALGYVGDQVKVRRGFARNYLVPRGIAVEALSDNARLLKHRMQGILAKRAKLKSQAEELAAKINSVTLEFVLKAASKGKSFGSVQLKEVEAQLKAKGVEVDRSQIRLPESMRRAGDYQIGIKLHAEVTALVATKISFEQIKVEVRSDDEAEVAPVEGAAVEGTAKPKRARRKAKAGAEEAAPAGDEVKKADAAPTVE